MDPILSAHIAPTSNEGKLPQGTDHGIECIDCRFLSFVRTFHIWQSRNKLLQRPASCRCAKVIKLVDIPAQLQMIDIESSLEGVRSAAPNSSIGNVL
jgi:hypothetical protein